MIFKYEEEEKVQRAKDIFEYYNQGIEKIVQQFATCSDVLHKIQSGEQEKEEQIKNIRKEYEQVCENLESEKEKKREEKEEVRLICETEVTKAKKKKAIEDNQVACEQSNHLNENQEKRQQYQKKIISLTQEIEDKRNKKAEVLTDLQIQQKTEQYKNNIELYENGQKKYIEEKEDKALKKEIDEKNAAIEDKKKTLNAVVHEKTNEQFPMLDAIKTDQIIQGESTEEILTWAQQVPQTKDVIHELAQEYAATAADNKRAEHDGKAQDILSQQQRNRNWKAALQKTAWWIFCFPRNLYRGKQVRDGILDIACLVFGIFLSFIIYAQGAYALFVLSAVAAGTGIITGFLDRVGKKGTMFQMVKNTIKYGITLLPYPLFIYCITRVKELYFAWMIICLLLYFGYDIYYWLKRISPNYKKIYKQYYDEALMIYQGEADSAEKCLRLYDTCLREKSEKAINVIKADEEELEQLKQKSNELLEDLKKKFEEVWKQLVVDYAGQLKEKQGSDIKYNENVDHELQRLLEEKTECETLLKTINDQGIKNGAQKKYEELEEKMVKIVQAEEKKRDKELERLQKEMDVYDQQMRDRKKEAEYQVQMVEEEFQRKRKELLEEFEVEIEKPLKQLEKDGFKEICGFDYREVWPVMHAMATNTLCLPVKRTEIRQRLVMLAKELKKQTEVPDSSEFVVPKNLLTGFLPVDMGTEIQEKIKGVLEKCEAFQKPDKVKDNWDKFGDDIEYFQVKQLPANGIYKLKVQEIMREQILFVYNFGNLNQETQMREKLRDFIIRTFAYGLLAYNSYDYNAFQCNVIVLEHKEDYDKFKGKDGLRNSFRIYSESREAKKLIDEMYNKEEIRKCQELIVTNINQKEFGYIQDAISSLAAFAGNQSKEHGGIYPYFFMDKNDLSDKSAMEHCKTFIEAFGGRIMELKQSVDGEGYDFKVIKKRELLDTLTD